MKITGYKDLGQRIEDLRNESIKAERDMESAFDRVVTGLDPVTLVKSSVQQLSRDHGLKIDVVKAGMNMGANFLIDKIMGRRKSFKGFLSSILLEKYSHLFIDKGVPGIIQAVANSLKTRTERDF